MDLLLAIKAFFKALKKPIEAQKFLSDSLEIKPSSDSLEQTHLRLLSLLQQSSRLVDFLKEDINPYTDSQVGASVRKIHADCGKCLEEMITIRPVMEENEGSTVRVPVGYDPAHIKVVGKVKGEAPFTGTLVHKGWKAHKRSLPKQIGEQSLDVICAAEVEIK